MASQGSCEEMKLRMVSECDGLGWNDMDSLGAGLGLLSVVSLLVGRHWQ